MVQRYDMSHEFVGQVNFSTITKPTTSTQPDDTLLPFTVPAIKQKKVIASVDDSRLSSRGGVAMLTLPSPTFEGR